MDSEKQAVLEKIKFTFSTIVAEHLIDAKVKVENNFFDDNIVLVGVGCLWAEKAESKTIKYPKDWIQAIKERWLPKFLLKHFPVIYTIHTIDAMAIYNKFRPSVKGQEYHILLDHRQE